jgi:hypothetical protein
MARQEEIRSDFESLAEGKGASGPVAQNVGVFLANLRKNDGKWPFIVDFPMKNGDFP